MKITIKGQVTIPQRVREKLGLHPHSEVDFVEENDRVYLVKKTDAEPDRTRFRRYRGAATVRMSTEAILKLTRRR
jgi:AbrB family looped-hinge helix DNA binding protein